MKTTMMMTVAMLMASTALVSAADGKRIPTLKVGKCEITLLESNGIKPLEGAKLDLNQAVDGKTVVSAVANKSGLCEITVAEGRYILSINEKPITLINAAKDGEMAWARIVLSESPMMIGGAVGATSTVTYMFMGVKYTTLAAAIAAATAAGVGVDQIVQNNEGGSDEGPGPSPSPSPSPTPDDDDDAPGVSP